MVGIDALSQQIDAVKQLSDHHELPVCAVHAPCLLITQRVWGTEPWGKLERSAEMAHAVGADVVVVHPPFRWQRTTPPASSTASRRSRSRPASPSRSRTCTRGGPRRAAAWRCTCPAGTRPRRPTPTPPIDLSHAAIARARPVAMAERLGDRLRHIHLTDGTGSAKDEHLVPGRGAMDAAGLPAPPRRRRLRRPHRAGDQHPQGRARREEREADLRESLEFAREHFRR